MQFTTTILAAFLSASALAAPVAEANGAYLDKRQCEYNYLPTLWPINSLSSQPASPITDRMQISRDPAEGFTDTLVEFDSIPQGSWGCTFELDYQPSHRGVVNEEHGDPQQINVYALTDAIPAQPTWANVAPITGSLVGTFNFPTGDNLDTPARIFINSFQCAPTMRFRLSMNQQSLGFVQNYDDAISGLRVAHNC
jgi:hypothetical protein